jgi:chaperonin GroEL (HSP60 family)
MNNCPQPTFADTNGPAYISLLIKLVEECKTTTNPKRKQHLIEKLQKAIKAQENQVIELATRANKRRNIAKMQERAEAAKKALAEEEKAFALNVTTEEETPAAPAAGGGRKTRRSMSRRRMTRKRRQSNRSNFLR